MSEFTPEAVAEAVEALYTQTGQRQQQANAYIVTFMSSESALPTTFALLQSSDKEIIQEIAALALGKQIMTRWNQIDESMRVQIKSYLLNADVTSQKLLTHINRCLVMIAIFEWPESWPDFLLSLLAVRPEDPKFANVISILGILADEIEKCDYIVQSRRQMLRNVCLESLPELVQILSSGISSEATSKSCLQILCSLLKWGKLEDILSEPLMVMICGTFLQKPDTMELAVACLDAVFLHSGPRMGFDKLMQYFGVVVHGFVVLGDGISENGLAFLAHFLEKYTANLEVMSFGERATLNKDEVVALYRIILEADLTEAWMESFWLLWREVMRRLNTAVSSRVLDRPPVVVYMPVLPDIRRVLMEHLVLCIDKGRITDPNALGAWNLLAHIDPDGFLSFIQTQPPSPALTYAIGFVEGTRDERLVSVISAYISNMWSLAASSLRDVAEPLLFVCSHSPVLLPNNEDFLKNYLELLMFSFGSADKGYQIAASHSLWHYSTKITREFPVDVFLPLVRQIPTIASGMDSDPLVRLMSTLSRIASKVAEVAGEFASHTYSVLTQSSISLFGSDVVKALLCIREIAYSADQCCSLMFENLWGGLFDFFTKYMTNTKRDVYVIELALDAIAAGIVNCEWETAAPYFRTMIETVSRFPDVAYISFDAIAVCRARHMAIDGLFPEIWKLIEATKSLSGGLFRLLGELTPFLFDLKSIFTLLLNGIKDTRNDVSYAAVVTTRNIIDTLDIEPRAEFLRDFRVPLFETIISTMLDCLHSSVLSKECMLLLDVFLNSRIPVLDKRPVQDDMMQALTAVAPEPQEGFYRNFVQYLTQATDNKHKFKMCIMDFLVLMKRAAPVDSAVFFRKSSRLDKEFSRELSDILTPSMSFDSLSEPDDIPIDQSRPLRIRKRGTAPAIPTPHVSAE